MTAALLCLIMAGTGVAEPENLVTNPAFRSGFLTPTDWSFNSAEDNRVDWQSGDVPGERAVLLQGSGADWAGLTSRRFAVSPGEQIAVVALMRTLDGAAGSQADRLFVRFFSDARFIGQEGPTPAHLQGDWTVLSGVVTAPDDARWGDVSLQIRSKGRYQVASVACVKSTDARDAEALLTPAPASADWKITRPEDSLPPDEDSNGLADALERFLGIQPEDAAKSIRLTRAKTTSLQTHTGYREDNDLMVDIVIIAGNRERDIRSWATFGYEPHVMVGFRAGPDYLERKLGDLTGRDEVQTDAAGNLLDCGPGSYYMVPTANRRDIFRQYFADAVTRGAKAVCPEEPEFFARAGYSEAFKREWQAFYGEPWQDPASSVAARTKAERLKMALERQLLEACYEGARSVDPAITRFLLTHSPLNYTSWGITFGHQDILATGQVDAMIAQVWTGTARSPVRYQGKRRERTFENGYLEYASCLALTRGTNIDLWFLMDPLEDNPDRSMEDYLFNYKRTLAAALMFPEVSCYETMPWPVRIFGRVPDGFATTIGAVIELLSDMQRWPDGKVHAGTPGVGTFLSDSAMWQRGEPHSGDLDCFYGIALPLLMKGIPVEVPCLDRADEPGYLDRYQLLFVSYDMLKPVRPEINQALADWATAGGKLVVLGGADPYNAVPEWWRQAGFESPQDHLLHLCGVDVSTRKVAASLWDGLTWKQVATTDYSGHEVDLSRQEQVTIDLTPFLQHGTALVRCRDSIPTDGFGALITRIRASGLRDGDRIELDVVPDTPAENEIILAENHTGLVPEKSYRFCDRNSYVIYRFDFDPGTPAQLVMEIGNQYLVDAAAGTGEISGKFQAVGKSVLSADRFNVSPDLPLVSYEDPSLTGLYTGLRGTLMADKPVGQGRVITWGLSPSWFARSVESAQALRDIARYALGDDAYREQAHMTVERGPYVVCRTLGEARTLTGPFIDLVDPLLSVLPQVQLGPDDMAVLKRWVAAKDGVPRVIFASSCLEWKDEAAESLRIIASGALGTTGVCRIDCAGRRPGAISSSDVAGNPVQVQLTEENGTILLSYPNHPRGIAIRVMWARE